MCRHAPLLVRLAILLVLAHPS
ncbi:hypothetical protein BAE44_0022837 [Dichanthelium oligosanthes]|uniref:Uncharacterized protein n=1 Tax=Dichanthelium oligosanthes TaxID=888268 RepID=A0A1E5UTJ4_9POAL|nr:hypothetical protein BAE44_0022837 [Dichanthelium oligosanthes]